MSQNWTPMLQTANYFLPQTYWRCKWRWQSTDVSCWWCLNRFFLNNVIFLTNFLKTIYAYILSVYIYKVKRHEVDICTEIYLITETMVSEYYKNVISNCKAKSLHCFLLSKYAHCIGYNLTSWTLLHFIFSCNKSATHMFINLFTTVYNSTFRTHHSHTKFSVIELNRDLILWDQRKSIQKIQVVLYWWNKLMAADLQ